MKKKKTVLIIAGDKRQRILAELLSLDGYTVTHIENENYDLLSVIAENEIIFLPLPLSKDRIHIYSDTENFKLCLADVVRNIKNSSLVFGGGFSKEIKEYFEEEGIEYHDCLASELFELQNAYLTAQGALKLLYNNTEEFLKDKKVLVAGYGRIAVALSEMLRNLRMKVTVAARNELQLKTAEHSGCDTVNIEKNKSLSGYDFIFNTVPHRIFDEKSVSEAEKDSVYFELASAPFGADKEHFEKYGLRYVSGASLPGKFLPRSSAKLLKEYMEKFI